MMFSSDHLELNTPDKFMQTSMVSTNYSSSYKSHSSKETLVEVETFRIFEMNKTQFQNINNDLCKTQGKSGFKKMSRRPLLHQKSRHQPKWTLNIENQSQINKIVNYEPKSNHKKDPSIQQLQARYAELDEQLKKLKIKQNRTNNNVNKAPKKDNEYSSKALVPTQNYNKKSRSQVYESNQCKQSPSEKDIQCLSVKPSYRNSIEQKTEKKSYFFNKLNKKMKEELDNIKNQNQNTQSKEISLGCQLKKNNYNNQKYAYRNPLTDRVKSKISMARSGVQTTSRNTFKRKRSHSARQTLLQLKEFKFKMEKIQQQENFELRGIKIEVKKAEKFSKTHSKIRNSEPQINITFRHIIPIYKHKNWTATKEEVEHEKMKEKMLNILIDCEAESSKQEAIQQGIKVFEAYTKKMGNKLDQKGKLLNIQTTQSFEDNEVDEEYH